MTKLEEVIGIINEHCGEEFRYVIPQQQDIYNDVIIYNGGKEIIHMKANSSKEELLRNTFKVFIKYIAVSKFNRKEKI